MTPDCLEILRSLVGFPTVSRETNLPMINWIRNYLADLGVESHLIANDLGTKFNLLATIGPSTPAGLVLSGHTDVVSVSDQAWTSDPFTLTIRDSRLHGRGTSDMKSFIAAVLARVPGWQRASLTRPVHLMFSYDEEVGCLGIPSMIAMARNILPPPAAVVVGEPTSMRLATRHKGLCLLHTKISGIEAHSSLTDKGESAIMIAGELIAHLCEISERLASGVSTHAKNFSPPHTTVSVNRISGGTANNILAALCDFIWEIRSLPGVDSKSILQDLTFHAERWLAKLSKQGKLCGIKTTVLADVPPLQAEHGGRAAALVRAASITSDEDITVPFGTEAGYFQQSGWSTVVCGPGDIQQAHRPDEFIERSQLVECEAFLDRLVYRQPLG